MTTGDYVFGLLAPALWAAAVWRAVRVRPVGALWWATVCIAAVVTLKTGLVADPFNVATGGIYLDELLGHLLGVAAGTLVLAWLLRDGSALLTGGAAAVLVVLVVTWFLAPVHDIPASADWIPEPVLRAPVLLLHWFVLDAFLVAFAVTFVRAGGALARTSPTGPLRRSLHLLVAAAGGLGLSSLLGMAGRAIAVVDGETPAWVYTVQNALLAVVFALFVIAVASSGSLWTRTRRPATSG